MLALALKQLSPTAEQVLEPILEQVHQQVVEPITEHDLLAFILTGDVPVDSIVAVKLAIGPAIEPMNKTVVETVNETADETVNKPTIELINEIVFG